MTWDVDKTKSQGTSRIIRALNPRAQVVAWLPTSHWPVSTSFSQDNGQAQLGLHMLLTVPRNQNWKKKKKEGRTKFGLLSAQSSNTIPVEFNLLNISICLHAASHGILCIFWISRSSYVTLCYWHFKRTPSTQMYTQLQFCLGLLEETEGMYG